MGLVEKIFGDLNKREVKKIEKKGAMLYQANRL